MTRRSIKRIPDPALRRLLLALHGKRSGANWAALRAYNLATLKKGLGK